MTKEKAWIEYKEKNRFKMISPAVVFDIKEAVDYGYDAGYQARDEEVAELRKHIEECSEALTGITDSMRKDIENAMEDKNG